MVSLFPMSEAEQDPMAFIRQGYSEKDTSSLVICQSRSRGQRAKPGRLEGPRNKTGRGLPVSPPAKGRGQVL